MLIVKRYSELKMKVYRWPGFWKIISTFLTLFLFNISTWEKLISLQVPVMIYSDLLQMAERLLKEFACGREENDWSSSLLCQENKLKSSPTHWVKCFQNKGEIVRYPSRQGRESV